MFTHGWSKLDLNSDSEAMRDIVSGGHGGGERQFFKVGAEFSCPGLCDALLGACPVMPVSR